MRESPDRFTRTISGDTFLICLILIITGALVFTAVRNYAKVAEGIEQSLQRHESR